MSIFSRMFGSNDDDKNENVVLLIKARTRTGGVEEKRIVVERREVQTVCDEIGERTDLAEVWVYQKILHHTFPEQTDDTPNDTSGVLTASAASLAFGVFGAGRI